jgi:A/G-specific adenine glycosylase
MLEQPRKARASVSNRGSAADVAPLRRALVRWYRVHRRDLPWRRTCDPYRIWISEIMLQQTRIDSARPYYERFVRLFPDVESLARAALEEVLHAWSGLGYYTRARNLHAAARSIVEKHAARFPTGAAEVTALPGIGPYTAGAILSIAFGQPAPILDGNVVRVFARLFALEGEVESAPAKKALWSIAERWARCRAPGDANQALMELGATVCTKPVPDCGRCPLETRCAARSAGLERELPRPRRRLAADVVHLSAGLVRRGRRLLLVRRASGSVLRDWWEVPTSGPSPRGAPGAQLAQVLSTRLGMHALDMRPAGRVRHGILNHRLEVEVFVARAATGGRARLEPRLAHEPASRYRPPPTGSARVREVAERRGRRRGVLANLELEDLERRWVEPHECRSLPLSTLTRKTLLEAAGLDSSWAEYVYGEPAEKPRRERRREPARENL